MPCDVGGWQSSPLLLPAPYNYRQGRTDSQLTHYAFAPMTAYPPKPNYTIPPSGYYSHPTHKPMSVCDEPIISRPQFGQFIVHPPKYISLYTLLRHQWRRGFLLVLHSLEVYVPLSLFGAVLYFTFIAHIFSLS